MTLSFLLILSFLYKKLFYDKVNFIFNEDGDSLLLARRILRGSLIDIMPSLNPETCRDTPTKLRASIDSWKLG